MPVQMAVTSANAIKVNARGATQRSVVGQVDTSTAEGRAVQLAVAANTTKFHIVERSVGQLSAARSDLLLLQEVINEMQGLITRQLQIATDQVREFEINGAENPNLTDEYDSISDKRDALAKNLVTHIDGLISHPFAPNVDLTLYDGTHINFSSKSLTLAMIYASLDIGPEDLHRAANGGVDANEVVVIDASVNPAPPAPQIHVVNVGGFNAPSINLSVARVRNAITLDQKVSVELAKRFESFAVALSKIDDALTNAGGLAASLRQNNTDLATADKLGDAELQNKAETAQKSAAYAIADDIDHQMAQMQILKQS